MIIFWGWLPLFNGLLFWFKILVIEKYSDIFFKVVLPVSGWRGEKGGTAVEMVNNKTWRYSGRMLNIPPPPSPTRVLKQNSNNPSSSHLLTQVLFSKKHTYVTHNTHNYTVHNPYEVCSKWYLNMKIKQKQLKLEQAVAKVLTISFRLLLKASFFRVRLASSFSDLANIGEVLGQTVLYRSPWRRLRPAQRYTMWTETFCLVVYV